MKKEPNMALDIQNIKAAIANYNNTKSSLEGQLTQLEAQKQQIVAELQKNNIALNELDTTIASLEEDITKEMSVLNEIIQGVQR